MRSRFSETVHLTTVRKGVELGSPDVIHRMTDLGAKRQDVTVPTNFR